MSEIASHNPITDEARLSALKETELLDSQPDEAFDRLTKLVQKLLNVPVALVSLVDKERQFFKSGSGLPEPWATIRETPLSHSFCQHVVANNEPLIVPNAKEHALVCDNLAVRDLNVIAYLGIPLRTPEGYVIGSLCAIDSEVREWNQQAQDTIQEIAHLTMTEIAIRHELKHRAETEQELQRKAEALEKSNATLLQFAYAASHDIQEPLRTITSFSKLLQDKLASINDEEIHQYFGFITSASSRMSAQIKGLLAFSTIEPKGLKREHMELNDLISSVLLSMHELITNSGVRIHYDALPEIFADRNLMTSLMQNLISNAIKYSNVSEPKVTISAEKSKTAWKISVQDNGIGIEEKHHDSIFQLFKRLHSHSEIEGSGIGLATCQRIVEFHNGNIGVESTPGKGANFFFTLPRSKTQ